MAKRARTGAKPASEPVGSEPAGSTPLPRRGRGAERVRERGGEGSGSAPAGRPSALIDTRVIYCGDCLEQLRKLPDACVDLIYIDPPFNSNRNYEVFWGETKEKRAFDDRHASTQSYINYMRPRCYELRRILKDTGSFYYHCDWHAWRYEPWACKSLSRRFAMRNVITTATVIALAVASLACNRSPDEPTLTQVLRGYNLIYPARDGLKPGQIIDVSPEGELTTDVVAPPSLRVRGENASFAKIQQVTLRTGEAKSVLGPLTKDVTQLIAALDSAGVETVTVSEGKYRIASLEQTADLRSIEVLREAPPLYVAALREVQESAGNSSRLEVVGETVLVKDLTYRFSSTSADRLRAHLSTIEGLLNLHGQRGQLEHFVYEWTMPSSELVIAYKGVPRHLIRIPAQGEIEPARKRFLLGRVDAALYTVYHWVDRGDGRAVLKGNVAGTGFDRALETINDQVIPLLPEAGLSHFEPDVNTLVGKVRAKDQEGAYETINKMSLELRRHLDAMRAGN